MDEIGLELKQKREENGVSIEEAAEDLQMRVSQLESIEAGRKEDFKDIFSLKYFIRDYAKYLGLDGEVMLDKFNEYLYEQTSKISLEEIEEAKKVKEEHEKDMKILSPYTLTSKDKRNRKIFIIISIIVVLFLVLLYLIVRSKGDGDDFTSGKISYVEEKSL